MLGRQAEGLLSLLASNRLNKLIHKACDVAGVEQDSLSVVSKRRMLSELHVTCLCPSNFTTSPSKCLTHRHLVTSCTLYCNNWHMVKYSLFHKLVYSAKDIQSIPPHCQHSLLFIIITLFIVSAIYHYTSVNTTVNIHIHYHLSLFLICEYP